MLACNQYKISRSPPCTHTCDNGSIAVEGRMGGEVGGDLMLLILVLLFARLRGEGLVVLLGVDMPLAEVSR